MATWRSLLEELLEERRPALIGYAALMTGDRAAAEDLVHDAIVRTFGRPRSFPSLNAVDAYVRRAIANGFIDGARSRKTMLGVLPRMLVDEALPEDAIADRMDVRAALRTLPPRQRTCVVLRFYDDMLVADIAQTLGLSDGAVKRYLSDGIHHLNAKLGTSADPDVVDVPLVDVRVREGRAGR
ncbi:sigma-70 family RNA polymerase sigma factor [Demequina lutea]|uniref:RNA polymerase sigma-70 factor (ECF subfamily) n=1 Tax=Demequina lutea TaxID=431489 RepID=A0A7Y9Z9S3_9MICO|nr:sigma-70 family RNA polymerase sigma factor [Demequina lutea]NYI41211.1 RNA polymerase sigma-70 factor (ECF subfamily) [Demequina lutea]